MNIAEYIEQNMKKNGCRFTVFYHKFAKAVGLTDIRVDKEGIESDLQELFKCRLMKYRGTIAIQSCLIEELFFAENGIQIDFSHWSYQLRAVNSHWLSDILKQTRLNNYIVKGD